MSAARDHAETATDSLQPATLANLQSILQESPSAHRTAWFLDVDGTLLDFAQRPDLVVVETGLIDLLLTLQQALDGALALVSGRDIETLDLLFGDFRPSCAGLHGTQLRLPDGRRHSAGIDVDRAQRLVESAEELRRYEPGLLLERKGPGVALHYRGNPHLAAFVEREAERIALEAGPLYTLQRGNHVVEIRLREGDKGSALRRFMTEPPFAGRLPIMIGDDYTDEPGFEVAQDLLGVGVIVGPRRPTAARLSLVDPAQTRGWLTSLCEAWTQA